MPRLLSGIFVLPMLHRFIDFKIAFRSSSPLATWFTKRMALRMTWEISGPWELRYSELSNLERNRTTIIGRSRSLPGAYNSFLLRFDNAEGACTVILLWTPPGIRFLRCWFARPICRTNPEPIPQCWQGFASEPCSLSKIIMPTCCLPLWPLCCSL
jgi:hypothetical protein